MAEVYINSVFQLKRGNAEAWARNNPTLEAGEPGVELDTGKLKVGNGITPWNELEYIGGEEIELDLATQQEPGLMSSEDKQKVDTMATTYVAETMPADAPIGSLWIDTSVGGLENGEEVKY